MSGSGHRMIAGAVLVAAGSVTAGLAEVARAVVGRAVSGGLAVLVPLLIIFGGVIFLVDYVNSWWTDFQRRPTEESGPGFPVIHPEERNPMERRIEP